MVHSMLAVCLLIVRLLTNPVCIEYPIVPFTTGFALEHSLIMAPRKIIIDTDPVSPYDLSPNLDPFQRHVSERISS